jgi:transposase
MPVKTDRKDARGIAELMRLGWFRPVHCKSTSAQETRAFLTTRRLIEGKLRDIELSLRGNLRGFGLKVGKTTATTFAERIKQLVSGHPTLEVVAESLLAVREVLLREFRSYEKRLRTMARHDERTKLLMTTTGVGPIISLTYASAIDDPARFEQSKTVGAHYGMTPRKYQSGETEYSGRISKIGDKSVRTALYQAAHIILTRPVKGSRLKSWGMKLAKRIGMAKAKVAVARKLAVIMHRMLVDGTPFDHRLPKQAAAA